MDKHTIMVVGGAGYVGSHMVKDLLQANYNVITLDDFQSAIEGSRRSGDPAMLIANSDKIRKELGWQPRFEDLETILRTAWLWHQNEASHTKN